jgi:AcrR family transcriptional regulator
MGRPKVHGEQTRADLLAAAEHLVAEQGIDAVNVRDVAARAGTTTRAVYVLFGSKEGLLAALARQAFELLMAKVAAVPPSSDPGKDLITRSVKGFRPFALEHPDLFRLLFVGRTPDALSGPDATASRWAAYAQLVQLVEHAQRAGILGTCSVEEATVLWDALCTGLALREICGPIWPAAGERLWTEALEAFLNGMGSGVEQRSMTNSRGHGVALGGKPHGAGQSPADGRDSA